MQSLDAEIVTHDDDVKDNLSTLQDLINNIGAMDISDILGALYEMEGNLTAIDLSLVQDIEDVEDAVEGFVMDIQGDMDAINATLDELQKLQDILDDLAALDTALEQGNDELKAEIDEIPTEKKEEEEGFGMVEVLLIVIFVLLLVNLLVGLMGRKGEKEGGMEALPEKRAKPESKETWEEPEEESFGEEEEVDVWEEPEEEFEEETEQDLEDDELSEE